MVLGLNRSMAHFLAKLIVLVFGVLLLVDGALGMAADASIFEESNPLFESVIGLVFILFGVSFLTRKESI